MSRASAGRPGTDSAWQKRSERNTLTQHFTSESNDTSSSPKSQGPCPLALAASQSFACLDVNKRMIQSCGSCHHLGDRVPLGQGNDIFDECRVSGSFQDGQSSRSVSSLVSRQVYLSLSNDSFEHVPSLLFLSLRCERCFTSSCLPGAAITCETVSRSGTAMTSSTGALVGVPRGPVKLFGELWIHGRGTCRCVSGSVQAGLSAGDVPSDAGDGMAGCARLGMAPLHVDLRIFWGTTFQPIVVPSLPQ